MWVKHWQNHIYYSTTCNFFTSYLTPVPMCRDLKGGLVLHVILFSDSLILHMALDLCKASWWFKFWCVDRGNLTLD